MASCDKEISHNNDSHGIIFGPSYSAPKNSRVLVGDSKLKVEWGAKPSNVKSQRVYYSKTSFVSPPVVPTGAPYKEFTAGETSVEIPNLTNGDNYYAIVVNVRDGVNGEEMTSSAEASATPSKLPSAPFEKWGVNGFVELNSIMYVMTTGGRNSQGISEIWNSLDGKDWGRVYIENEFSYK